MSFQKLLLSLLIGFLLALTPVFGQSYSSMADSIDIKFDQINESSRNYQDNKIVKKYKLADLRTQTLQSINKLAARIDTLQNENIEQQEIIDDFKAQLEETETTLEKTRKSKNQFSFLGMSVQKSTYQLIVIMIIIVLVFLLLFYIYNFRKSREDKAIAESNLVDKEKEFDEFRRSARTKHQKIARQLLDERKKNEENKSGD